MTFSIAPAYGKDTEETRVHNVIANGHEACERSEFPQGEVLRGHTPPCPGVEPKPVDLTFFPDPKASPARTPWRGLGACVGASSGFTRAELNMPEEPLASRDVVCDEP